MFKGCFSTRIVFQIDCYDALIVNSFAYHCI